MDKRTVFLGFTTDEYSQIEREAQAKGISVTQYCKSRIIDNEFNIKYAELLNLLEDVEPNTEFTIKDLWKNGGWEDISRGVKLALGKHFFKNVEKKKYDVAKKGFGKAGIMCYVKLPPTPQEC